MTPRVTRWSVHVLAGLAFGYAALAAPAAQNEAPPIGGLTGTIALEGTMKAFYRAANTIIVTTMDGVEHVYHVTKALVVHGATRSGIDALEGLHEGTIVVVHYIPDAAEPTAGEVDVVSDEGLSVTEGTVSRIDRERQQITIEYANGKTEVFRLTDRAAAEARKDVQHGLAGGSKVVIYYKDEHGRKVVHFFKQVS